MRTTQLQTPQENPTRDDPDVHPATRGQFDTSEEIIAALSSQETRSPLDDENCCAGGDKGFRVYKTDLPVVRSKDLKPGLLVYRPTPSPLTVYEIRSEPYVNDHRSRRVDVTAHSRSHAGDDAEIRTREQSLFQSAIEDTMTFVQPENVQKTLPFREYE